MPAPLIVPAAVPWVRRRPKRTARTWWSWWDCRPEGGAAAGSGEQEGGPFSWPPAAMAEARPATDALARGGRVRAMNGRSRIGQ